MANTTITNLPLAIALTGTEQLPAVQSTTTVRLTVAQIATYTSSTMAAPVVTIGGAVSGGTPGNGLYVSSSGTLGEFPYGAGIFNAIQIAAGSNGAPVLFNGAGGTPTSLTLTLGSISVSGATNGYLLYNNGGLLGAVAPTAASLSIGSPISNGAQAGYGLYVDASNQLGQFAYGTGVRTALGVAVGSAGAPVLFNGAGGQPTSINLTGATALSLPIGSISATGTPSASTYLRGDGTWATAGGGVTVNTGVTNQLSYYSGTSAISGNANATISGGALTLGVQSTTAGSLVLANTNVAARATTIQSSASASAAWTLTLPVSAGSSTNVLSTDGTGVTSWAATVTSVAVSGGTTGLTTSGGPITTSGTITLAGTLAVANGGTGQSTALTQYGVIYGSSTTAMGSTAAGTTGQVLIATTSAAPSWGQVPIAGGGTGQTTTALGTIVVGASGSTTANLAIGTTGQILTVSGGTAAWASAISPTTVNSLTLAALSTGFSVAGGTTSKTLTVSNTLTLAGTDGKTLTVSNSLTLAGTDSTTMTFPPASASIGYLNIPQNSQSGNYTLVLADSGKHVYTTALATITIPANSSVAFPIGTAVTFINSSASATTIAITTDTMNLSPAGTTGSRTLAQYGMATAIKVTSTVWYISGTGLT